MISLGDAARILAKIAAYDQRTVGDADIAAWHEALNLAEPPIGRDDALAAVARWHAEATEGRIRPANVIQGAQQIAHRRAGAERRAELDQQMAIEAAETVDRTPELTAILAALAEKMGTGDRTKLRRKEWVRHERQQRRAADIGPNPLYDPQAAARLASRESGAQ